MKLFCLPYAGGSSRAYISWNKYIDKNIEVVPLELAGRGTRVSEPMYQSFDDMVSDIYNEITNRIDDKSYGIFGHSMGAWLGYEVCHKLTASNIRKPDIVFFSGKEPPFHEKSKRKIHNLPFKEFKHEIIKAGGTSEKIFENPQLLSELMPILRSDYKITENYIYNAYRMPLDIEFVVFGGVNDDMTKNCIQGWRTLTSKGTNIFEFNGGHFFINEETEKVVERINMKVNLFREKKLLNK